MKAFAPGQPVSHSHVSPHPESTFREINSRHYFSFTLLPPPPWKTVGKPGFFTAGAQGVLLDVCASACLCVRLLLICPVSLCRNGFTQSTRSESFEPSSQLEEQSGCSQGSPRREGSLPRQSPEGPHQHERTVLTEPLNWVQKSNSWDIKPGQMFCSPTNNTGPSASGE